MVFFLEKPRPPRNWGTTMGTIILIGLLFFGVYFLFFKKPVLIEMAIPAPVEETRQLSKITFDPLSVQNSEVFKSLRQYSSLPTPGELGRANPFLPY